MIRKLSLISLPSINFLELPSTANGTDHQSISTNPARTAPTKLPCHATCCVTAEFAEGEADGVLEVCDTPADDTEVDILADDTEVGRLLADDTVKGEAVVLSVVPCCVPGREAE